VISLEAVACNTVELFWWDWSLFQWPSGYLQCFDTVGWVIWPVRIVPAMTYKVSNGTLNLCSLTHRIISDRLLGCRVINLQNFCCTLCIRTGNHYSSDRWGSGHLKMTWYETSQKDLERVGITWRKLKMPQRISEDGDKLLPDVPRCMGQAVSKTYVCCVHLCCRHYRSLHIQSIVKQWRRLLSVVPAFLVNDE